MSNKFIPPQTTTATRTASTPIQGEILYDTDENQLYYGDGSTQGGKNLQGSLSSTQEITFIETTEPTTPSANDLILYVDTVDGVLKQKNDAGTVTVVGGNTTVSDGDKGDVVVSSSGTVWELDTTAVTPGSYVATNLTVDSKGRITAASSWTPNITTLSDAANIAWDMTNQIAQVTLADNRILDNPTNIVDGMTYTLHVIQDATGGRTLTYGSVFKWPGGTAPTLSTGANAVDIIMFVARGGNLYGSFLGDFS